MSLKEKGGGGSPHQMSFLNSRSMSVEEEEEESVFIFQVKEGEEKSLGLQDVHHRPAAPRRYVLRSTVKVG